LDELGVGESDVRTQGGGDGEAGDREPLDKAQE
jgi:hypothetical protein